MTRCRLTASIAPLAVMLALSAGCGGSGSKATLQPGAQPTTHQLSETDGGTTVHARVGDDIVVTLHSTYWRFAAASGALVAVAPPKTAAGGPSCSPVPGSGCGTVRANYRVTKSGKAQISASRSSCGEALRCTGRQGRWSVSVVASG